MTTTLETAAPAPEIRPGRRPPTWLVLLAASLPMFIATLDNLVMTNALPVLRTELNASVEQLQWFVNAYALSFATLMLTASTLGDRIGRRRVFVAGIVVFTLASITAAMSTGPGMLIAARAVQGAGAAAIMPLSLTLLAAAVPPNRRAAAIGVWGGVSGLGIAVGPVIGGGVVDGMSWEWMFWINVPVAIVAIPLIQYALAESKGVRRPVDVVGTLLIGGSVFLGIWGIVNGNEDGWSAPAVLGSLVAAGLLALSYLAYAARRSDSVLPLRLFAHRGFSVANVASLAFSVGMFGAVFLLAQNLQIVMGYSPFEAGLRTLPWTAAPMVVAPIAGLLADRVGIRPLLVIGLGLQTVALLWLARLTEDAAAYGDLVPAFVLAGVGMGLTFAPMATAVLDGMPDSDFAIASSANATAREFGVAGGIAMLTAVFVAQGGELTPTGYAGAIGPALYVGALALGVAFVAALFAPKRPAPG